MISGRVAGSSTSNVSSRPIGGPPNNGYGNGDTGRNTIGASKPKLTGMFEGLTEMPKLKSVGTRSE